MPPCLHCHVQVDDGYKLTPFTTEKLRWYLGGAAEAAMGVRSTHQAFENMMTAGPSSGGVNLPELRMTDARLAAAGLERCVRVHRLAGVEAHHLTVLRAAYSGDDWTRLLDERVGKGPRLELQRLFTHELLQVAPLTLLVVRGATTVPPTEEAGVPVYRSGATTLASFRKVLALLPDASVERVRARLSSLAAMVKTGRPPRWLMPTTFASIAVLVGEPGEDLASEWSVVVKRARSMFGAALRLEATPEASRGVSYVAREVVRRFVAEGPTEAELKAVLEERDRYLATSGETIARLLKTAEARLVALLADQPSDAAQWSLSQVQAQVRQALAEFGDRAAAELASQAGTAWEAGQVSVDAQIGRAHV